MNHVDTTFKPPVILSFCSGILGLDRGLERAVGPINVACYCEIEAFSCFNLVKGMEKGFLAPIPIWTNAKTFPAQIFRGKIDGIIGGYPCQPFSTAGKREGRKDKRHIFPDILRHIKTIRPFFCFFENVRGHLTMGYDEVYRSLREAGYAVECGIYSAEEVGAPHQRERLFILAVEDTNNGTLWDLYHQVRRRAGFPAVRQGDREECAVRPGTAGELADHYSLGRGFGRLGSSIAENYAEWDNRRYPAEKRLPLANANGDGPGAIAGSPESAGTESEGPQYGEERDHVLGKRGRSLHGYCYPDVAFPAGWEDNGRKPGELGETAGNGRREYPAADAGRENVAYSKDNGDPGRSGEIRCAECRPYGELHTEPVNTGRESVGYSQGICQREQTDDAIAQSAGGRTWDESGQSGELADTPGLGMEGVRPEGQQESDREVRERLSGRDGGRITRWPAGPGEEQYEWEAPRTIESSMGCTAHGYNFREDFLRGLGNAVVEECAEVAFVDLLTKLTRRLKPQT